MFYFWMTVKGLVFVTCLATGTYYGRRFWKERKRAPAPLPPPKVDLGGTIFLINTELVLVEMMELARHRVAKVLVLPPELVSARLELLPNGKPGPVFEIDPKYTEGVTNGQVREVVATVYAWMRVELAARLDGLKLKRPREKATT